jgi:hypothetical protein
MAQCRVAMREFGGCPGYSQAALINEDPTGIARNRRLETPMRLQGRAFRSENALQVLTSSSGNTG